MHSSNSLKLILDLEAKIDDLLRQHKSLERENSDLKKKEAKHRKVIEEMESERKDLKEKIQQLSVHNVVHTEQWDSDQLKKYLDEVITLLDQNIKML